MSESIAVLNAQVAAKIAAGEVIERPSAVVRELLDNAIDAGAVQIALYLEEGGLQLIRVTDDGFGMSPADLKLCYLSHATSKIRETKDLLTLGSLGFRGEALGAIAACSKLRIRSAQGSFPELGPAGPQQENLSAETSRLLPAFELSVADSTFQSLRETSAAHIGTQVEVRELFYSFPARRKFLKSTRAELASCRTVFREKALGFPHIYFRLYNHGKMELSLPPGSTLERICQIYGDLVPEQLFTLNEHTENFSVSLFAASAVLYRRDRKRMPIYINSRPIVENSLWQAVRLGFEGYLAGGLFPVCFSFLQVTPDRVDFNIHPAKREARLRDLSLIQASIRQNLRNFCRNDKMTTVPIVRVSGPVDNCPNGGKDQSGLSNAKLLNPALRSVHPVRSVPSHIFRPNTGPAQRSEQQNLPKQAEFKAEVANSGLTEFLAESHEWNAERPFRYLGQLFAVFLLVECERDGVWVLLIVDQHASHERILYETLKREMLQKQPLLVPISFTVEEDESLCQRKDSLSSIGIQLEQEKEGTWRICSLPPSVSDFKEELIDLLRSGSEAEDLKRELFAHLSCRKAIKKGDILDEVSANELLHTLFSMGLERCPHGRPLWHTISQPELYRLLQRT